MQDLKISDRVKQKHTRAERHGTIIGFWENDEYIMIEEGKVLFAISGEVKVKFDLNDKDVFVTFSKNELIKL